MKAAGGVKFDPNRHVYNALNREAPKCVAVGTESGMGWKRQEEVFLGRYSDIDSQKLYEYITVPEEQKSMAFSRIIEKFKSEFRLKSNTILDSGRYSSFFTLLFERMESCLRLVPRTALGTATAFILHHFTFFVQLFEPFGQNLSAYVWMCGQHIYWYVPIKRSSPPLLQLRAIA